MRILSILIIVLPIVASCSSGEGGSKGRKADINTVGKAVSFMQDHLMSQMNNPEVETVANGMITITGEGKGFVIDPSQIVTGLIDEDRLRDAVLPVYSLNGQSLAGIEYLLLLQSASGFVIAGTLTNLLSVEDISDRMITAVVSTVPPDVPGYGCEQCRDTVQYRYVNGRLTVVPEDFSSQ